MPVIITVELDSFCFKCGSYRRNSILDDRYKFNWTSFDMKLAGSYLRDIQEIFDKLLLYFRVTLDRGKRMAARRRIEVLLLHHLDPREDYTERSAKLVR